MNRSSRVAVGLMVGSSVLVASGFALSARAERAGRGEGVEPRRVTAPFPTALDQVLGVRIGRVVRVHLNVNPAPNDAAAQMEGALRLNGRALMEVTGVLLAVDKDWLVLVTEAEPVREVWVPREQVRAVVLEGE